MRKISIVVSLLACVTGLAQDRMYSPPPQVVEKGPHHRVWETVTTRNTDQNESLTITNQFTELQTGLHYWDNGQWTDSAELVESFDKGAVARKGQNQVIFSPNLNVAGAIHLLSSDGQAFRVTPVSLSYYDSASGKSVILAEVQDCQGEIWPPNQVNYEKAFKNINAAVRYTYTKAGLEQDVVLHESPPSPSDYGLDPATTRLEIWSEFIEAPILKKGLSCFISGLTVRECQGCGAARLDR